jgi:hypothetical protein
MTSSTAHDHDGIGFVDAARHLGDVRFTGEDFRSRLERGDTRDTALGRCGEDVYWKRQMRDTAAGVGGGDGLMNDGWGLCR